MQTTINNNVKASIKCYGSNSDIFFGCNDESIGFVSLYHTSDNMDMEEDMAYNIEGFRERIFDAFESLNDKNYILDSDSVEDCLHTISIYISPLF